MHIYPHYSEKTHDFKRAVPQTASCGHERAGDVLADTLHNGATIGILLNALPGGRKI